MNWFKREMAESGTMGFLSLLSLCIMKIHNRSSQCLINKDAVGHSKYVFKDKYIYISNINSAYFSKLCFRYENGSPS